MLRLHTGAQLGSEVSLCGRRTQRSIRLGAERRSRAAGTWSEGSVGVCIAVLFWGKG